MRFVLLNCKVLFRDWNGWGLNCAVAGELGQVDRFGAVASHLVVVYRMETLFDRLTCVGPFRLLVWYPQATVGGNEWYEWMPQLLLGFYVWLHYDILTGKCAVHVKCEGRVFCLSANPWCLSGVHCLSQLIWSCWLFLKFSSETDIRRCCVSEIRQWYKA